MSWWKWCRRKGRSSAPNPDPHRRDDSVERPSWDAPTDEYELLERCRALGRSRQGRHW